MRDDHEIRRKLAICKQALILRNTYASGGNLDLILELEPNVPRHFKEMSRNKLAIIIQVLEWTLGFEWREHENTEEQ